MLRNRNPWAVAALAALLFLFAAYPAFASPTDQPATSPEDSASMSATVDSQSEPAGTITLTLELNDGVASTPQSVYQAEAFTSTQGRAATNAICYLGTPYRWGGTTPRAFDCSGFVRYVYNKLGVSLPRTARQQYKAGKVVSSGELKPGDLIFFDMMKGYVSHVGMYLGSNKFIHASTPKQGVRIDSLQKSRYKKCFVGARRFVT